RRRQHAFGRAPGAHHGVDAGTDDRGGNAGRQVAVADETNARAGRPDVGDQLLVAFAVEHDNDEILDLATETPGDRFQVLVDRRIEADVVLRTRSHDQLLHVEIRRVQQAALIRRGEHRDRVGRAGRAQVRAFQRVYRNIDLRKSRGRSGLP